MSKERERSIKQFIRSKDSREDNLWDDSVNPDGGFSSHNDCGDKVNYRRKTDQPQTKRLFWLSVFGYGTLILTFGFICLVAIWIWYPYKTVKTNNVNVLNPVVQQGGTLSIELDYDRYTDIDSIIVRQFKDGIAFTTPISEGTGTPGHYNRLIEIPIPETLPPGQYTLTTTAIFKMNPVRNIPVDWTTKEFKVIGVE